MAIRQGPKKSLILMFFKRKQRKYYVMSLSPVFKENGPYKCVVNYSPTPPCITNFLFMILLFYCKSHA